MSKDKNIPFPVEADDITEYRPKYKERARIAIWVGHSDEDEGAESPRTHLSEFDYNSPVAKALAEHLKAQGIAVDVYRRDKWGQFNAMLAETNQRHEDWGYDLGISLHLNCYNTRASGTEVLFWHRSNNGRQLATQLLGPITELFDLPTRGIKPLKKYERAWFIVGKTKPVWCIIEGAFIDNPKDEMRLRMEQDNYDEAIVEGIIEYLRMKGKNI